MTTTAETNAQLQCVKQGGPFELVHGPKPTPAPDQIVIRQRVIALNLVDIKQRDHNVLGKQFPTVIGIEGAGIIEAVGSQVQHLQLGDEVAAAESAHPTETGYGGAFQEFVVVPARIAFKKPDNISLVEAASLPICFITAVSAILLNLKIPLPFLQGLDSNGSVPKSVLVLGGSSTVGAAAISLLRKAHPTLPILTTSSKKHHARLRELGATFVADYKLPSIVTDIKANAPGNGIDAIIDCVAASLTQTDIFDVFDPAGSKKYAAVYTGVDIPVPEGVTKFVASGWDAMVCNSKPTNLLPQLNKLLTEGYFRVPLPVRVIGHGLQGLPDILDEISSASGEKLVVTL